VNDESDSAWGHEQDISPLEDHAPLDWATTKNNLGFALERLGERESATALLEEAVTAYRDALMERTRERVPLDWVVSFGDQGVALTQLAERTQDAGMAETAYQPIEAALAARSGGHVPNAAYFEERPRNARRTRDAFRGPPQSRDRRGGDGGGAVSKRAAKRLFSSDFLRIFQIRGNGAR
jgi:tetratricopeptide repeat protein